MAIRIGVSAAGTKILGNPARGTRGAYLIRVEANGGTFSYKPQLRTDSTGDFGDCEYKNYLTKDDVVAGTAIVNETPIIVEVDGGELGLVFSAVTGSPIIYAIPMTG